MSTFWQVVLIVVGLIIGDFICITSAATTTSTTQSNVWFVRQNSSNSNNVAWRGPPTTPWPALGARRQQNRPQNSNTPIGGNTTNLNVDYTQNKNTGNTRNVGLDLSYGNTAQNRQSVKGSSGNVGVDLSYGLNLNQNQNIKPSQVRSSITPNQNLNYAKITQNNPIQQNVNRFNSNIPLAMPSTNTQGSTFQSKNTTTNLPLNEDDELREFSETLLRKDVNNAAKYVTINYQGRTTSRSMSDQAPQPLLTIEKEAYEIPSIANLLLLHNNYILETNVNEHVSAQEKIEENNLLDSLVSTSVMEHTRNFLIQKGAIAKDPKVFKDKLREIWFNMYSRGQGRIGSSGFEHVFLAEIKNNDISGLHNWLYFHDAEVKKSANYLGFLKKFDIGSNKGAILKYHFTLAGINKPVGSMFIGTSPELEIALYSTCFLLRADKICPLRFGGKNFIIRTYTYRYRGKDLIGSAFPEI